MFSAFQTFGRLGAGARAVAAAWSPSALWPTGTEAGMWIDPSNLTSQWQDSAGTTPVSAPGSVADSSNPVGLALDLRLGATTLTDPGNHLLQATSTARPLGSARVNLLNYTNRLENWTGSKATLNRDAAMAPDGSMTATKVVESTEDGAHIASYLDLFVGPAGPRRRSFYLKACERRYLYFIDTYWGQYAYFDALTGTIRDTSGGFPFEIQDAGNGWWRFSYGVDNEYPYKNPTLTICRTDTFSAGTSDSYPGDGVSGFYIWGDQLNTGSITAAYQPIPGDGSSYSPTGFPIYQKYDGTDDGMATASFAAGTLSNAMDCLIAVRRDSGANAVCGLYESVSDANKVFGIAESGSGSGCVGSGAGTPTVWVDGVQLTGGTAVTRGTLHTALTVGEYHVLEFRGLDLSTWTASGFGLYTSYVLNGAQGGILLFPSSTSAADRDAARTWLGAKVGLTL